MAGKKPKRSNSQKSAQRTNVLRTPKRTAKPKSPANPSGSIADRMPDE